MSEECHICGPVKHECPTVICAPCAIKGHLVYNSSEPACDSCGMRLMLSRRRSERRDHENGDGLCGPCERKLAPGTGHEIFG